jgi:hypothetical protein
MTERKALGLVSSTFGRQAAGMRADIGAFLLTARRILGILQLRFVAARLSGSFLSEPEGDILVSLVTHKQSLALQ